MIRVFATNVKNPTKADLIVKEILIAYPQYRVNFDLEDCDNILRIEGNYFRSDSVVNILKENGYECSEIY
ncbi:hypothetical protein C0V77_12445 [Emticicia sp. TH156]|nr:hypothetical protein C0V77_12445 [Emticicia sp. TH156]